LFEAQSRQVCARLRSCQTSIMALSVKPGAMRAVRSRLSWALLAIALAGCTGQPQQASAPGPSLAPSDGTAPCRQVGLASWYRGASRDRASPQDLVAAHRSLPFGTAVQVTSIETGQSVVVRINDRGPFGRGRIIDLSRSAADQLGMTRDGVAQVRLELVGSAGAGDGCAFQQARLG
jgi:rare lipoprotein A